MNKRLLISLLMVFVPFALFAEEWTDVTKLFLQNPAFVGNRYTAWTYKCSAQALNVNYECTEVYNGTFDFHQTLLGLPKGRYRLSVQGFYRSGYNENAYSDKQAGKEELTAVLYAGSREQTIKSVYDYSISESIDGLWTPNNYEYYPNNMASARKAFDEGAYLNMLEFDADGDIQIGIKNGNNNIANWCIFTNFKIEYQGRLTIIPVDDISISIPKTTLEKGETITASASILPLDATVRSLVWQSSDPFIFNVSQTGTITALSPGSARLIVMNLDGSFKKEITIIVVDSKESDDRTWTDVSYVINNATFDTNGDSEGWDIENSGNMDVRCGSMEFWNNTYFRLSQVIENLPQGHYRLSVQGFHRYGGVAEDYRRLLENEPSSSAYIFVNEQKKTMLPYCSYYESISPSDEWISPDGGKHWMPNTMLSASEAFAKDAYWNYIEFDVEKEREGVTIGIALDEYTPENWCIFTNFKLEYQGTIAPISDVSLSLPKTTLESGESIIATASVLPSNTIIKNISWQSSDPFVFNVNNNGKITALGQGQANLIVLVNNGAFRKETIITVVNNRPSDNTTWTDLSYIISNADFITDNDYEGWNIENSGNMDVRYGCMEFWNNTYFRLNQMIENLPQGHYRLSVQGFHRYGNIAEDYQRLLENEPSSLAYIFVNEQKKTMLPYCSYYESISPSDEWRSPDDGKHWMPNTMLSASEAFAKDAYWNYIEFDVEKEREGVTIGIALDEYTPENWCIFTNFKLETSSDIDLGKTYTLSVLDETGKDISSKVEIYWYDGRGEEIGRGTSIGGIKKDAALYYSVSLDEALGKQYREVTKHRADLGNETVVCQLQKIEEVALHGKIRAYGVPLPRVEVCLTQWLNGKYEYSATTLTDADGEFSMDAYNDSTELVVYANGYVDNKTVCANMNNGGELGTIEMIEVKGKVIALNLSYQEATKEGIEPNIQNWFSDTRNIDYKVQNLTKGATITDYGIQQGNIVLPVGVDRGDKIRVTVNSLNKKFSEVVTEGIIADNDTANINITLFAYGGIEAIYNQKADDDLLAMLYDSTGKLQMRTICSSHRLTFTNLDAGYYSLVTMGYNGAIGSVADLSDLASMDLYEGVDYVRNAVTVRDGYIASVNVASVPELDASKFEYTGLNTSYMPNKTQLVTGNFITLTARLDFKEQYAEETDNAKVVIEIPEGCEFVPNSVVIGAKTIPHSLNGNRLTITVNKEDLDSRIRFCVIPTQTGTFLTTAHAQFDYKGTKTQPMGQIMFEATSGELYVPSTTRTSTVMLGGIGVPKAEVEVYDNENLIGMTKSLSNGKWSLSCELANSYNLSTHNIYIKYRGEGNVVGKTESKSCFYDINAIVPKTVTMVNTAHPAGDLTPRVYETVFDYETVMSVNNHYLYWPNYPDFTFLIDLSENDTTKVFDVNLYVYTTDGDKRKLPAVYDGKLNRFVATSSFGMHSLPVNVSVDIVANTDVLGDAKQVKDAIKQCDIILAEDTVLNDLLAEIQVSGYSSESLFDKLFDYLEISNDEQVEIPENISLFLDEIIQSSDCLDFEYASGIMSIIDANGNTITAKHRTIVEEKLTIDDLVEFNNVPLTDGSNIYLRVNKDLVDVVFDERLFSFGISNGLNIESAKMARTISSDEFFTKWSQFRATLEGLNHLSKKNTIIANVKDFLLGGKNKMKEQLKQCRAIKLAYVSGDLSPQQLKELDLNKLEKNLSDLPVQIKKVSNCLGRLNALFKLIDIASIINDINNAEISRQEWNEIIDNIESIDCWDMVELSSKAKSYREWVARGYTTNIGTNVATCVGADKLLAFIAMASGALGATVSSLSMATMMEICTAVSLFITDCNIIQGGVNQIFDINRKAEIRLKIPTIKGKCDVDDYDNYDYNDYPNDPETGNKIPIHDPSGYVYEAVPTNRIEGVKATVYYNDDNNPVLWDAAEYGQINPQITEEDGLYAWDVPQGMWKVVFEKEDYEMAQTDWLPVPPPQLEVNIPMSHAVAPFVENAIGLESGITLAFSKYMKPSTLAKSGQISVTSNGTKVKGNLELVNMEKNPLNNEVYVSKIKFVPNIPFNVSDDVIVTVKKEAESYANKQMLEDFVQRVDIESEIKEFVYDSLITIDYNGTGVIELSLLPKTAANGKIVQVASLSPMIASVDASSVTLDEEGKAHIVVSGELPGSTSIRLSMPEAGIEKYAVVNVAMPESEVKMPKASKLNGSTFEESYLLSLSCATKGATIYYTIDGSCPCDEQKRIKYTGPIALPVGKITLKAIATHEGLGESDVAEYTYIVIKDEVDGIHIVEENHYFDCYYQDGCIVVSGAKGASCRIYDLQGRELGSRNRLGSQSRINVPKSDVYIVSVQFNDQQTLVHKIMAR